MAHLNVSCTVTIGDLEAEVSITGDVVTRPLPVAEFIERAAKAAAILVTTDIPPEKPIPVEDDYEDEDYE